MKRCAVVSAIIVSAAAVRQTVTFSEHEDVDSPPTKWWEDRSAATESVLASRKEGAAESSKWREVWRTAAKASGRTNREEGAGETSGRDAASLSPVAYAAASGEASQKESAAASSEWKEVTEDDRASDATGDKAAPPVTYAAGTAPAPSSLLHDPTMARTRGETGESAGSDNRPRGGGLYWTRGTGK
eukprot:TRINITY_DN19943_c0_g2_i1.p1 TRINITY_DN19943_c0_g2~~TRINITY_DN19943_c0_g2_i1.p1  ORF type:complete len:187 (-),score=25.30 TRINITY_DN19943_c0_g2_i1:384-944(-)